MFAVNCNKKNLKLVQKQCNHPRNLIGLNLSILHSEEAPFGLESRSVRQANQRNNPGSPASVSLEDAHSWLNSFLRYVKLSLAWDKG